MKSTGKSSKPIIAADSTKHRDEKPAPPNGKNTGTRRVSRVSGDKLRMQILERISDGILAFDTQMNYVYVDERAGELLGREPQTLVGKNFWKEYPNSIGTPFANACQRAFQTQTIVPFDGYFPPTNSWFEGRVYPSNDGLSVLVSDRGLPDPEEMIHALEKSEEKFSKAFHSSPVSKAILRNRDQYVIDINQTFLNLFGFQREEVIGRTFDEVGIQISPAWREALTLLSDEKGSIRQQEMEIQARSGEARHVLLSVEPIELDHEACLLVNALDITERKQAEERVHEISEFPMQNPNPIMRFTRQGKLMFANPAATQLLDLWKQPDGEAVLPEPVQEAIRRVTETQNNSQIEIDDYTKSYICLLVPVPNTDYINLYFSDITERKQVQESLQALVHQTATGITRIDLHGTYLFANQAFCDMVMYSGEELLGKTTWDINHPDDNAKDHRMFEQMVEEGEPYQIEKRFVRRDKSALWVSVGVSPLRDAQGQVYAAVSIIVDITRRKRAEESLLDGARRTLYLSRLSDALRQLTTPMQVEIEAPVFLGAHLKASRVAYAAILPNGAARVRSSYVDGMADFPGEFPLSRYLPAQAIRRLHADHTYTSAAEQIEGSPAANPVRAQIVIPLLRQEKLVGVLFVQQLQEREWKSEEISLAEETAERMQAAIEHARAERDLHESEKRFRILANTVPSLVWSTAPDATVTYLNDRWLEYTGLTIEESIANWAKLTIHPDDYDRCMQTWGHSLRTGEEYVLELRYRRHDGEYRWFLSHAVPERDEEGSITAWHGVTTDIHERVQREVELQQVINQTPFMLTRCTRDLNYRFVSRAYAEMIGRTLEEVGGKPIVEIIGRDGLDTILPYIKRVLQGERVEYELEIPYQGVGLRFMYVVYIPDRNEHGEVVGWFASITDISERKHAQEELERSNQKLNEILSSIQDDFYVLNHDWKFVYASRLFTSKVGKEPEDFIGNSIWEMFPKHLGTPLEENFRAAMEQREVRRFEIDGKYSGAWYRMTAFPSSDGITVLGTNITERKRAEDELRASEHKFSRIFHSAPYAVSLYNLSDARFVDVNDAFINLFGYSREELIGRTSAELGLIANLQRDEEVLKYYQEYGYIRSAELRGRKKSGELIWVATSGSLVEIAGEKYILSLTLDISDRKKYEESLIEYARRQTALYTLTDALNRAESAQGIYDASLNASLSALQSDRAAILLFDASQVIRFVSWRGLPEAYRKVTDGHSPWKYGERNPVPIYYDDIQTADLSDSLKAAILEEGISSLAFIPIVFQGRLIGKFTVYFDEPHAFRETELSLGLTISRQLASAIDRKQREEVLRARTEEIEALMEVSPFGIMVAHDPECSQITGNPAAYALLRVDQATQNNLTRPVLDKAGQSHRVFRDGVELQVQDLPMQAAARLGKEVEDQALEIRFEDGTRKYAYMFAKPLFNSEGKPRGAIAALLDITERRQREESLRARTEEVEALMEVNPIGIYVSHDPECKHITGNPAAYRLVEMPFDSNDNISKSAPEEEKPAYRIFREGVELEPDQLPMQTAARLGMEVEAETLELRFANGRRKYVYAYAKPLFDSDGSTRGAIAAMLDITERKENEEALRDSEERLRATYNSTAVGFATLKPDTRFVEVNQTFCNIVGYSREELLAMTCDTLTHPDYLEDTRTHVAQLLAGEIPSFVVEKIYIRRDGSEIWVQNSVSLVHDAEGKPRHLIAITQDITERKRAEDELHQLNQQLETHVQNRTAELQAAYEFLRQSEAMARLILESMPDAILATDKEGHIVYANNQVESLFGYSPEEVNGKAVEALIPQRFRDWHLEHRISYRQQRERRYMGLDKELYGRRKDNTEFPVDVMLSPISNNTTWDVMITIRDNSQQKQAQEALRTNEEKLRKLFEILPVGISFLDNEGKITEMNTALTQILGVSKQQLLQGKYKPRHYIRANGTPMPPEEFASNRARLEQKPVYNVETGIIKEDGDVIWTSVNATPVDVADVDVVIATIDITERKKAEDALHKHRERLRVLSRRLVEVQEEERRALAHELHDRVGQNLAALNLNLNILRSQLSEDALRIIGSRLDDSVSLVNQILTITRNVMADLRSNVLDDYGLELALREYADKFTQRTTIQVSFDKSVKSIPRLDPNIEMTLLRIAQEALTNVSRHAQADLVTLAMSVDREAVYMSIEDNGIGILSWQKANQPGSHGLRIIRERAEAFGGSLQVHSAYQKGTRIEVKIPIINTGALKSAREKLS